MPLSNLTHRYLQPAILLAVTFTLCSWLALPVKAAESTTTTESIVVTAARTPTAELDTVGNITQLSAEQIQLTDAIHPYELAVQVPGTWIGRGSGQEHLTAIRSPVLTGAGSCGHFWSWKMAYPPDRLAFAM
jgi:hypothetical protein